ncbi:MULTISPECIES: substrate-binding domain-containing protein [Paraburkholderia]|uniref:substrate-binding domain-containing protein n=1 Tax=Paraburkholderia TaxID=1822464 RepID=UPI002252792D|nr:MULTISPECIES: substrate-binding domain-containing protein [Paraburkholderia]MCX4174530.1 substrate-binding domain-containing protein [Paraburkholderia madseniana]MDQ6462531.1 substrate-binding domain-containing protein [Paraburkholderia madseniana]
MLQIWKLCGAIATAATMTIAGTSVAIGQEKPIKIALIASKTGPLESYARDTERGLRLGFEYATQGTMTVLGRKIEIIVKDDQMKPELSKSLLTEAYADDKADIGVGTSWSGGGLSMAPVAAEYKKILILEPSIADSLTGKDWNRYLFRASRNSTQDALASAAGLKKGDNIAFLATDDVYGHDGVNAFKAALAASKSRAKIVQDEFVPLSTSDFTAPMQRIFDAMKPLNGRKYIVVIWRSPNPIRKLSDLNPGRYGIEFLSIGGANLDNLQTWRGLQVSGGIFYYYAFPKNAMNDWLVATHTKRYGMPPDMMAAGGFMTASAIVTGLKKAMSADSEKLIPAMEGMEFDSPKGKATFRRQDHQAMQSEYQFRTKEASTGKWDLLELTREIPASEIVVPITTRQ